MSWTIDSQIKEWLPKLQAHRGYWVKGLQQNSLESIIAAYELGFEMAEFDVRKTAEGELILFHDDYFDGVPIRKSTVPDLRKRIPITTLEELFVWFSRVPKFKLNLEIKTKAIFGGKMETGICTLIRKYSLESRIIVSSFNPLSLYRIKKLSPVIYRALLLTYKKEEGNNWFVTSMMMNFLCRPHVLHLRYEDCSEKFKIIAKEVPIVLWTVNDLTIFKKYQGFVHGIISDEITLEKFRN